MNSDIKIIDVFSGPGGLGEGFSSFQNAKGDNPFKIAVSIEKEKSACRTLRLRSFFRKFNDDIPDAYYEFIKGDLGNTPEDILYRLPEFADENQAVNNDVLCLELGKDNRKINKRILEVLGKDECVLIGGPPCQAYSIAGPSRKKNYRPEEDERNYLYKEYLKIIARFQPMVFVMENVKGMLSAKINGVSVYETIFSDLQNPCKVTSIKPKRNYLKHKYTIFSFVTPLEENEQVRPNDFVIRSELYGIPQRRHRVILLGLREDIADNWNHNLILKQEPSVILSDVIRDLPSLRSGLSKSENTDENWLKMIQKHSTRSIKALHNNKDTEIAKVFQNTVKNIVVPNDGQGELFGLKRKQKLTNKYLSKWYYDKKFGNSICNHDTRRHMASDLQRYMFCSIWAKVGFDNNWANLTPKSFDYPEELMPNHVNFKTGKFADRFRVQPWNIPATTITSHISKDGHYFIHPDPLQCRSLTVREAARIQTFPDNYFFVGNRTEQYVQVGNAVPPLLAFKLARIIDTFLTSL